MYCVKKGGDRQALHERIRLHSIETAKQIKLFGGENDLTGRIVADEAFNITAEEINALMSAESFTGRAKEQTEEFLTEVRRLIDENKEFLGVDVTITV